MDLQTALLQERLASYVRLRGGYPIPLAGATWWFALSLAGFAGAPLALWIFSAAVSSGLLFPLALLYSRLLRVDFMKERTAVTGVLTPAFIAMLLFWPMAVAAWWRYPALVPLILAIGMSLHWPVIGWSYGRTALYSAHAVIRAVVVFVIWNWWPGAELTFLPLSVALIYLATVVAILIDSQRLQVRAAPSPS